MIASTTRRASALDGKRQPRSFAKRYWRKCDDTPTLNPTRVSVHVALTPATNTLPIKRLNLGVGESRDIAAAYVPLPDQIDGDFLPQRAQQRYTCLVPNQKYRYEGIFRNFKAELEVDEYGLVIDYPDTFRRTRLG